MGSHAASDPAMSLRSNFLIPSKTPVLSPPRIATKGRRGVCWRWNSGCSCSDQFWWFRYGHKILPRDHSTSSICWQCQWKESGQGTPFISPKVSHFRLRHNSLAACSLIRSDWSWVNMTDAIGCVTAQIIELNFGNPAKSANERFSPLIAHSPWMVHIVKTNGRWRPSHYLTAVSWTWSTANLHHLWW